MRGHDETIAAGAGVDGDAAHGSVMPPVFLSANYSFAEYGVSRQYDYTRSGNPTRDTLAAALAELERGAGGVVTSSGMAAIDLVLSLLDPGALVVAPHDCYGGTWRLLTARANKRVIDVAFVDQNDPVAFAAALARRPQLVWIETPSNPLMRIVDVEAVCGAARAVGAQVAVDNTFLSPVLLKPLPLGANFVVHSTTKYINGHSDVVGGAVIAAAARDVETLKWWANCCGVTGAPFDAWLTLRGLRTLPARLACQQQSAQVLAERLLVHPGVARVHYPGLPSHPQYQIACRQQRGFGAMLTFAVKETVDIAALLQTLAVFTLAESLGGVESLIAHPKTMTHAAMSPEARAAAGIGDNLLRLSVGLEHVDDLWGDLDDALSASVGAGRALESAAR